MTPHPITYCFFDTETHDNENPRLVQLAYRCWEDQAITAEFDMLYKPPVPITLGAMSVHHIRNTDIEHKDEFNEADRIVLQDICDKNIMIAHNLPFDTGVLKNEGVHVTDGICTLRVTKHLFPDLEQYKLQYLRYVFKIDDEQIRHLPAHDAMADVLVLEKVFFHLVRHLHKLHPEKTMAAIFGMMEGYTKKPVLLNKIFFGKHRQKTFDEIQRSDPSYLQWLRGSLRQNPDADQDLLFTVQHYAK